MLISTIHQNILIFGVFSIIIDSNENTIRKLKTSSKRVLLLFATDCIEQVTSQVTMR